MKYFIYLYWKVSSVLMLYHYPMSWMKNCFSSIQEEAVCTGGNKKGLMRDGKVSFHGLATNLIGEKRFYLPRFSLQSKIPGNKWGKIVIYCKFHANGTKSYNSYTTLWRKNALIHNRGFRARNISIHTLSLRNDWVK